jgi:hypothetical protein
MGMDPTTTSYMSVSITSELQCDFVEGLIDRIGGHSLKTSHNASFTITRGILTYTHLKNVKLH